MANMKIKADKNMAALRSQLRELLKGDPDKVFSRQVKDEDVWTDVFTSNGLLQPPYAFTSLYNVYEESDLLQECIDAMIQNVDGFDYRLIFMGEDENRGAPESMKQYRRLTDFFNRVNEKESFRSVRKKTRKDLEILGNGAMEMVRNLRGELTVIYNMPFRYIRLTKMGDEPVPVTIRIPRDGQIISLIVQKYFRKYAQVSGEGKIIRWFKSFGDPRIMDCTTGEFITDSKGNILPEKNAIPVEKTASEILHLKNDVTGGAYGVPRWVGAVFDVLGRRLAQYVNYDLFDMQGIPPLVVTVAGGCLTEDSLKDLKALLLGARGYANFNKLLVLEATSDNMGLDDRSAQPKLEIKNLTEYRKEDQMFGKYLESTERAIRHIYRLAPLYVGASETYTHATAKSAKITAEEQVFSPIRVDFDELLQNGIVEPELMVNLWHYRSGSPQIVGSDEMSKGVETFSKAGAFSINNAIEMANRSFGLQMSTYTNSWAEYPLPLVLRLVEQGRLKDLDDIDTGIQPKESLPSKGFSGMNTEKSEVKKNLIELKKIKEALPDGEFTDADINLYHGLLSLHEAINE